MPRVWLEAIHHPDYGEEVISCTVLPPSNGVSALRLASGLRTDRNSHRAGHGSRQSWLLSTGLQLIAQVEATMS